MNQIKKIVVPWDFSDHSNAALHYAVRRFRGDAIKVVCVLEPPTPFGPGHDWGPDAEEIAEEKCRNEFRNKSSLPAENSVTFQVRFGDPATEICQFAETVGSDYIALSTHGRTGIQKLFIGSVAQKVIGQSTKPVILLPTRWFALQRKVLEQQRQARIEKTNIELLVRLRDLNKELSAINIDLASDEQIDEETIEALGQMVTDVGELVDQAKAEVEEESLSSIYKTLTNRIVEFDNRHPRVGEFLTQMTDVLAMMGI